MLTIIHGPMFAGKSTALISRANDLQPDSYIAFKPQVDVRYSAQEIVTHNREVLAAIPVVVEDPELLSFIQPDTQTIIIDELNFFPFDPVWREIQSVLDKGIHVIGAGLLHDFRKQPFGATLPLLEHADEAVALTAICDFCGKPAPFSYRKVDSEAQFLLGAEEKYGACCEECWVKLQV